MYFPIMIELENRITLIVGGGKVAYRKAKTMLEFGGQIVILSPEFLDEFQGLVDKYKTEKGRIRLETGSYDKKHLRDKDLVIAATSSRELNKEIVRDCKAEKILVNNADGREGSDFINMGIYRNDNLTISISTGGSFPYLSKKIRTELGESYGKYNKEYLDILEEVRYKIIKKYPDRTRQVMDKILELDIDELRKFKEDLNNNVEEI